MADISGVGLGLRFQHLEDLRQKRSEEKVPWLEVISENLFCAGGPVHKNVEGIRSDYPMCLHGVGMSLGSEEGPDASYLKRLKELVARYEPTFVSDHLCWSRHKGAYYHDLFPSPFSVGFVDIFVENIKRTQDTLKRRILVENISSYLEFVSSEMSEWEFVVEVVEKADCDLLLDVNNIYVNGYNHGFEPTEYLKHIPKDRVKQIHLAGFTPAENVLIDTHGTKVADDVWDLYRKAISQFGSIPTLIEWDQDIPEFNVLYGEALKAKSILEASE